MRLAAYREERLGGLGIFCYTDVQDNSLMLKFLARNDNPQTLKVIASKTPLELKAKGISQVTASFPVASPAAAALRDLGFKPWGARFWSNPEIIVTRPMEEGCLELLLKSWDLNLEDWMVL